MHLDPEPYTLACRLAKERQAEDHLFGDKDAFVTGAYKKKLQEDQMWLAEERVREEMEKREDVVKKGHMGDFYGYVLPLGNYIAADMMGLRQMACSSV